MNKNMDNFNWLKSLKVLNEKPWHNDKVIKISDIPNHTFYEEKSRYKSLISPAQIKGIEYAYSYNCFNEITWLDLLNGLKRFKRIRQNFSTEEQVVNHIHKDHGSGEEKSVKKYGDIYITTSGQHRMALAKFLEVPKVEVEVSELRFNYDKYRKYLKRKEQVESLTELGLAPFPEKITPSNYTLPFTSITVEGKYVSIDEGVTDSLVLSYNRLKTYGKFNNLISLIEKGIEIFPTSRIELRSPKDINFVRHLFRKHKMNMLKGIDPKRLQ